MLLTLIVIDNRNQEACHCQRRVVVADCCEPVHMQWKLRNGVGSRVYQKKDGSKEKKHSFNCTVNILSLFNCNETVK